MANRIPIMPTANKISEFVFNLNPVLSILKISQLVGDLARVER
jgi:hypothetical protein